MRRLLSRRLFVAAACVLPIPALAAAHAASPGGPPVFAGPRQLPAALGGTEPRVAEAPDGTLYAVSAGDVVTTGSMASATVYLSRDHGATWTPTAGSVPGQIIASPDVDIVVTRTGRVVVTELDVVALSIVVSYSDDGGRTWTPSSGLDHLVDQDRPWLATGPDDPGTHQPRVYLLFHNGFSGNATENMYVETSTDGGATFGLPVPLTQPGSEAFLDLQCGDTTGPSGLLVNQSTGRLYAFWNTRHGALGACGLLPVQAYTIVATTRVWVATSPDNSTGSWAPSLAVDGSAAGNLVGMQFAPGALDSAGNVYAVYPESPRPYPDFSGAAIRVRRAPPDLSHWSAPITIVPARQPGSVLTHIVAGDPGSLDIAYFEGVGRPGGLSPQWYMTVTQITGAVGPSPVATTQRLSEVPAYSGTASQLMGVCDTGPIVGVASDINCHRSSDNWGIALGSGCNLIVSWASLSPRTDAVLGASTDATWVDVQRGGPTVCAGRPGSTGATGPSPPAPVAASRTPNSSGYASGLSLPIALAALGLVVVRRWRPGNAKSAQGPTGARPQTGGGRSRTRRRQPPPRPGSTRL